MPNDRVRSFVSGWRQLVFTAFLVNCVLGCISWRLQGPTPERVVGRAPSVVRLTLTDHSTVVLHNPKLVVDSVKGQVGSLQVSDPVNSRQTTDTTTRSVALPLSAITTVSVPQLNWLKTTGAVLGGIVLGSVVGCAVTQCFDISPH
jgi:hypothetical protein